MQQHHLARQIAITAHHGQMYSENKIYFYHLNCVANLVCQMYQAKVEWEVLDKLLAIAYLHDVIEDTDTTVSVLAHHGICDEVIHAVVALTKTNEPHEAYISKVLANEFAVKVKLCDTASNLEHSIQEGNMKRINKYTKQIQLLGGFQ